MSHADAEPTTPSPSDGRAGNPADNQRFRDWNVRNILTNLIQAEEHARLVEEGMDPEHIACINKHLLATRGEFGELMGHTDREAERELAQEMFEDLDMALAHAQRAGEVPDLDDIKRVRKRLEPHTVFDPSNCEVCGVLAELFSRRDSKGADMDAQTDAPSEAGGAPTALQVLNEATDSEPTEAPAAGAMEPDEIIGPDGDGATASFGDAETGQSMGPIAGATKPVLDTLMIPDFLDVGSARVARYHGTPLASRLGVGVIDIFTSELGKRVAAGGISLAMLTSIATGVVDDNGTINDFLMATGVGLGEVLNPGAGDIQELRQDFQQLMNGDMDGALIDDQAGQLGRELSTTADDLMTSTEQVNPMSEHTNEEREELVVEETSSGSTTGSQEPVDLGRGGGGGGHTRGGNVQ